MNEVIPLSLAISFLWAIPPIIQKSLLKTLDQKALLFFTWVFYSICVIIYAFIHWDVISTQKLSSGTLFWIAVTASLSGLLGNIMYLYVLKRYDSHIVTALTYSSPFFTMFLAYMILHEKITLMGALGVTLIAAGVICLAFNT
jgi:drug/metabolite transporter (DMT)-like permease